MIKAVSAEGLYKAAIAAAQRQAAEAQASA